MPRLQIHLKCQTEMTFRTQQVIGMFELEPEVAQNIFLSAEVPSINHKWHIGAIVGDSGSGKTSIARAAFGDDALKAPAWDPRLAIIDQLGNAPIECLAKTLTSVGLGSVPTWVRPFHVLSGGEQFRANFARQILSQKSILVGDEFTSPLDRTLARNLSIAVARFLRRQDQSTRLVVITSHRDVLPWLAPDWTLDMNVPSLSWRRLRRPCLRLQVRRGPRSLWPRFARHHYLSGSLSCAAKCYVALEDQRPVAFCAVISMLGRPEIHRISRLVTLPEYQGLGIGGALLNQVAQAEHRQGFRVRITTTHPAMAASLSRSSLWRFAGRRLVADPPRQIGACPLKTSRGRLTVTFEFTPPHIVASASAA